MDGSIHSSLELTLFSRTQIGDIDVLKVILTFCFKEQKMMMGDIYF